MFTITENVIYFDPNRLLCSHLRVPVFIRECVSISMCVHLKVMCVCLCANMCACENAYKRTCTSISQNTINNKVLTVT